MRWFQILFSKLQTLYLKTAWTVHVLLLFSHTSCSCASQPSSKTCDAVQVGNNQSGTTGRRRAGPRWRGVTAGRPSPVGAADPRAPRVNDGAGGLTDALTDTSPAQAPRVFITLRFTYRPRLLSFTAQRPLMTGSVTAPPPDNGNGDVRTPFTHTRQLPLESCLCSHDPFTPCPCTCVIRRHVKRRVNVFNDRSNPLERPKPAGSLLFFCCVLTFSRSNCGKMLKKEVLSLSKSQNKLYFFNCRNY